MRTGRGARWIAASAGLLAVFTCAASARAASPGLTLATNEISSPWSADLENRYTRVTVTSSEPGPITVTIRHDGRRALTFRDVTSGETLEFRILREFAEGDWTATAESGTERATAPIHVAIRWTLIGDLENRFDPCITVGWHVEAEGAPVSVREIGTEISAALDQFSTASGLTFVQVDSPADADLLYSWVPMDSRDNPGMGGFRITDDGAYQGFVELNALSDWVTRPGFDYVDGEPGRGILLLHETGHALGLGHVGDVTQVMNTQADSGGPNQLADGDRAGLAWLYRPQECAG